MDVVPVLVLAGPGAPEVAGGQDVEGVRVLAFRDSDTWRPQLAALDRPVVCDEATARQVADVLLEHVSRRTEYEEKASAGPAAPAGAVPGQRQRPAPWEARRVEAALGPERGHGVTGVPEAR